MTAERGPGWHFHCNFQGPNGGFIHDADGRLVAKGLSPENAKLIVLLQTHHVLEEAKIERELAT